MKWGLAVFLISGVHHVSEFTSWHPTQRKRFKDIRVHELPAAKRKKKVMTQTFADPCDDKRKQYMTEPSSPSHCVSLETQQSKKCYSIHIILATKRKEEKNKRAAYTHQHNCAWPNFLSFAAFTHISATLANFFLLLHILYAYFASFSGIFFLFNTRFTSHTFSSCVSRLLNGRMSGWEMVQKICANLKGVNGATFAFLFTNVA